MSELNDTGGLEPMPGTDDRGPFGCLPGCNEPLDYLESNRDWADRNNEAVTWLADNHAVLRSTLAELARLRTQKEKLVEALRLVRGIISEGAAMGFNWQSGNWAERLYASQGDTFNALREAGQ